jgi:uncharacterized membrane protein YeaQ/YmgE (transglycosylase-associated protein family)
MEDTGAVTLLVIILVSGLVVGALGRLLVPGPNPMGLFKTTMVGIGGAIVGGLVGNLLFDRPGGLILAVLGAAVIVWWIGRGATREDYY